MISCTNQIVQPMEVNAVKENNDGNDDGNSDVESSDEKATDYWFPPGADADKKSEFRFEESLDENFWVPPRLAGKSEAMVSAVNDFHFAMINDFGRNDFFDKALNAAVNNNSVVLEIGTGSGLLAMIAARHGAKKVFAVEANKHLCKVAEINAARNNFRDQICVVNKLSTHVTEDDLIGYERPSVLVSEILGTLMLSEGALDYVFDARERLLSPGATIIPAAGCQYATLIESSDLESITSIEDGWGNFDLSCFNALKDTATLCYTKLFGFRFSSVKHRKLSDLIPIVEVDFYKDVSGNLPNYRRIPFAATRSGTITAVMTSWEVYADKERTIRMSTHPDDTLDNFPRDMQWGQALQLIEDHTKSTIDGPPERLRVEEGDKLELIVRFAENGALMQFQVEKVTR